jgi:hypothetical protein
MTASIRAAVDQTSPMTSGSFPNDHSTDVPSIRHDTVDESVWDPLTSMVNTYVNEGSS